MGYIIRIIITLFFALQTINIAFAQTEIIESLLIQLEKSANANDSIEYLNELSWEYTAVNRFDEALKSSEKALEISFRVKNLNGVGTAYSRLGNTYYTKRDFDRALLYHGLALRIKQIIKDKKGVAASAQNIGNIYQNQTRTKEAIEYYLYSLKIKEELDDKKGMGNTFNSIGNVYKDLNRLDKALEYYDKSLTIRREIGDNKGIAYSLTNIGVAYAMKGDLQKTLDYTLESLEIFKSMGDLSGTAACYNSIGQIYEKLEGKKDLTQSLYYRQKSLEIYEIIQDPQGLAMTNTNIGNLYYLIGDREKTIYYLNKGLEYASQIGSLDYMKGTYFNLYKVNEKYNNPYKALEYYKLYSAIKDSILNDDTKQIIDEKIALYNQEKSEKELLLSKSEKAISETIVEKQRLILLLIILILFIAIISIIYTYSAYRKKSIANKLLKQQRLLIEQKNTENESLLAEIHHRVKNNLQVISSLLSLQSKNSKDIDLKNAISEGKQRVKSMELVHRMLYEGNQYASIEMNNYFTELIKNNLSVFDCDDTIVNFNINTNGIKLDIDSVIPMGLILNELITNSLKYGFIKDEILTLNIILNEEDNKLKLIYEDDGKGIKSYSQGDSFGLKLVDLLIKQLEGTIETSHDKGLKYVFLISHYKLLNSTHTTLHDKIT